MIHPKLIGLDRTLMYESRKDGKAWDVLLEISLTDLQWLVKIDSIFLY